MSIFTKPCKVLNLPVDSKDPDWFYHEIQENQEQDGAEEFLLQKLMFKKQLSRLSKPAYTQKQILIYAEGN